MRKTNNKDAGFTLVELIVAMIVGTIFVTSVNMAVNNYVHLNQSNKYLVLANSYVEGKAESLRNQGYNAINTGTTDITSELPSGLLAPRSSTLEITNPSGGIKQVSISISYSDQGAMRNYSYTTYVGELGVGQ